MSDYTYLRQRDKTTPHRSEFDYPVKQSTDFGLDQRCGGCEHPRGGRCPYVVSPKFRITWPCYFRLHVERTDGIDIPQGPLTNKASLMLPSRHRHRR